MESKRFRDELLYQTSVKMAKGMRERGIITDREYKIIRQIFIEKYSPILGTLLAEIELT